LIRKNDFIRNVLVLSGGAALGQAALLAVSPIVARIYTPEQFGVFGVYLSMIGFVAAFASLRLELAIPLQEHGANADTLTKACIQVAAFVSACFAFSVYTLDTLGYFPWVSFDQLPAITIAGGIFFLGAFNVLTYRAIATGAYTDISIAKGSYGFIAAFVQVIASAAGALGLIASDIVSRLLSGLYLRIRLPKKNASNSVPEERRSGIGELWGQNKKYPLVAAPSAAINAAGVHAPTLFFAALYGPGAAGSYIFAVRVVGAPTGLIGQAVSKVYVGEVAKALRSGGRDLVRVYTRTVVGLIGLGAIPFGLVALFGPTLFAWIFGEPWRYAGDVVSRLSPMLFFQFITVPVSQTLNLTRRQWSQGAWDLFRLLVILSVFAVVSSFESEMLVAVTVLSISVSACYAVLLLMSLFFAAKVRSDD
jgi:O-antigen/teichoic acid export membrane protein